MGAVNRASESTHDVTASLGSEEDGSVEILVAEAVGHTEYKSGCRVSEHGPVVVGDVTVTVLVFILRVAGHNCLSVVLGSKTGLSLVGVNLGLAHPHTDVLVVIELVHRSADAQNLVHVVCLTGVHEVAFGGVVAELENLVLAVGHIE